ncbi:MFS transporter [Rhodococcus qingshengii]|uniref:MFS transporter n=1 Tax=Rhodococcus qingshengii TaxID=334542 RepID=UPI001ABF3DEA|nr:MFS transporter [Rhodococcus qingshengii]
MTETNTRDAVADRAKTLKRIKWGVVVGSALEWFDFYLYASMAALVFGHVFFPSEDSGTSTLAAFSTFAVGFLARPFGGMIFGYLGDRIGRKSVLTITFMLMGVSTGLIGLIPSYAAIGIAAPILLVITRIFQGMGAGAEGSTAAILAYEHADRGSRGRQAAWPSLGSSIGLLASSLTVAGLTSLDPEFLHSWGWRIPFVFSFILIGVGTWVRRHLPETPEFEQVSARAGAGKQAHTIRDLMRTNWRALAVVMVFTIGYMSASYTFKTFSLSYLYEFRGIAANVGSFGIALASLVAIGVIPIVGRLCDRYDPRLLLLVAASSTALLAFPFFWMLNTGQSIYIWVALIIASGVLMPTVLAASGSFLSSQFPTHVRSSGVAVGREVGGSFAGGLAPLAALSMVAASDTNATWGVSLLFIAAAACIAAGCIFDQTQHARSQTFTVQEGRGTAQRLA